MLSKKFNKDKFKKLIQKGIKYLNRSNLTLDEKLQLLSDTPGLSDLIKIDKEDYLNKYIVSMEEERLDKECIKAEDSLDYSDKVIRQFKENWTQEYVHGLLLKVFDAYDFNKLKYDMEKKNIISKQYSVRIERITDLVNLFVNDAIKGEEQPYTYDKYGLIFNNLFHIEQLLKWKYRDLVKLENRKKFNYSNISDRYKKILENLFN